MNSSHRDSRASSNSTEVTEGSSGRSGNSNSVNRSNGKATNEMEIGNGDVAIDSGNGDPVITTQVTSILNSPWNSNQASNGSNTASRDFSDSAGFVFVTCDKEIRSDKRKTSKSTSTIVDIDSNAKISASSRSRTKSRSSSTSIRSSSSSKRKSESVSRSKKSAKVSENHESRKTPGTFNNLSSIDENTTDKDNNTKNSNTTTPFPTPTDKSNSSTFNTTNILSSLAITPGLLNKAKSLSQPNLRDRNEYERLS